MSEVEKMNEAMYERLGEIAKFASNKRGELDPDFKGDKSDETQNRLMLAAFRELRLMVEFYKPEEKEPIVPGCPSLMPRQLPGGFDGVESGEAESLPLQKEDDIALDSAYQREEARQKRKIHWKVYPTKVDVCAMGKTEQNGKVYEVRVNKRGDAKVQDTYGQAKVNGKTVLTVSFTGNAWMLKRILTEGMQALVNYKAKKNRDSRRNYAKRDAAKKAAGEGK